MPIVLTDLQVIKAGGILSDLIWLAAKGKPDTELQLILLGRSVAAIGNQLLLRQIGCHIPMSTIIGLPVHKNNRDTCWPSLMGRLNRAVARLRTVAQPGLFTFLPVILASLIIYFP